MSIAFKSIKLISTTYLFDDGFGTGGIVTTTIGHYSGGNDIALRPDGKLIVVGRSRPFGSQYSGFVIVRYNSNGTLDDTFGSSGVVNTSFGIDVSAIAEAVAIQSDSKFVAAGYSGSSGNNKFALARYTPEGKMDATFGNNGILTTAISEEAIGFGLALDSAGRIVVAGYSGQSYQDNVFTVLRYLARGEQLYLPVLLKSKV